MLKHNGRTKNILPMHGSNVDARHGDLHVREELQESLKRSQRTRLHANAATSLVHLSQEQNLTNEEPEIRFEYWATESIPIDKE